MQIQPYLFFDGRCDEAIEFYRSVLGAEVSMLMRFKEMPLTKTFFSSSFGMVADRFGVSWMILVES